MISLVRPKCGSSPLVLFGKERGVRTGAGRRMHRRERSAQGRTKKAEPEPQEAACVQVQEQGLSCWVPVPALQLLRGDLSQATQPP